MEYDLVASNLNLINLQARALWHISASLGQRNPGYYRPAQY